jgi:hypothetical protein
VNTIAIIWDQYRCARRDMDDLADTGLSQTIKPFGML